MNWDAAGAIGEIVGAIAVVITLAYLAKQQIQTNRVAQADLQRGIFYRAALNHDVTLSSDEAAHFLVALRNKQYDQLSDLEIAKLEAYVFRHMNLYASVQTSFDQGLLPAGMLQIYKEDLRNELDRYPALTTKFVELYGSYTEIQTWEIFEPVRVKVDAA